MAPPEITTRPIDFARDEGPLKAFLSERDKMRLDHCEAAVRDGDCYIVVADEGGLAVGWAAMHVRFRDDQDWDPPDDDTRAFQDGDSAYLENIEVKAGVRSQGVGIKLLEDIQDEARRRGKKQLWLHTSENNALAHRLFDREGWEHVRSVYPPWKPASYTRIYRKAL